MQKLVFTCIQLYTTENQQVNTNQLHTFTTVLILNIVVMETLNLTFDQLPQAVTLLTKEVSELKNLLLNRSEQPTTEPSEKFLTVKEAAEFLNLAVPTIYSKVSRNELPYMKRGKRLYFSSVELMEYLKEGRSKSDAELDAEVDAYLSNTKKGLKS